MTCRAAHVSCGGSVGHACEPACRSGDAALCEKKRVLCAALGIPLVWFFVLLTGANASSVRAGIMQTMLLVSGLVRRERDPWTAFSAALLVLLAENPWSLRNVGLLLSFASTGGILLFSKPLYHAMVESKTYAHLEDHHPFLARGLRPGITATCCSLASSAFSFRSARSISAWCPCLAL